MTLPDPSNDCGTIHFLSAGAGSGKTFRLTDRLKSRLVAGEVKPGGILATTFTRKAAAELRERVRGHLIDAGLFALANEVEESQIGTVNSVCGELVKRFSFELGLSPDLRVLDEKESLRLLRESVDRVIEPEERLALSQLTWRLGIEDESDVLEGLVANARSNDLAAEKLAAMGSQNADALIAVLCLAPDETVEAQVKQVIDAHLPQLRTAIDKSKPAKNTSTYLAAVQKFRSQLEHDTPVWADWARLASHAKPEVALVPVAEVITAAAERYAHHPRLAEELRRYLELIFVIAARALKAFAEEKQRQGVIDFVDQEALLLHHLEHPLIEEALREQLQLVVVDEFQDTSPLQLAIFLKLARLAPESVWVGDIKQAIYGFRGTDTRLMQALIKALPSLNGQMEVMNDSWRSRPALVSLANRVFGHAFHDSLPVEQVHLNPKREEHLPEETAYEVWQLEGKRKELRHQALAYGLRDLMDSGRQVHDKATGKPRPLRYGDIAVLVRMNSDVAPIANALREQGLPCGVETFGLLEQPEAVLALACLRRVYDPRDTLATAEVLSLGCGQPPEEWLKSRLDLLAALPEGADNQHLWGEADFQEQPADPLLKALAELRRRLSVLTPAEALANVMAIADMGRVVTGWSASREVALGRLANLDALQELAHQYEDECTRRDAPGSIPGFLFWLKQLQRDEKDHQARPMTDAVTVMTHHGAKGLEWPVVVLLDLGSKIRHDLWSVRAEQSADLDVADPLRHRFIRYWVHPFGKMEKVSALKRAEGSEAGTQALRRAQEEQRRLLYVSFTRARDLLILGIDKLDFDQLEWLREATDTRDLLSQSDAEGPALPSSWGVPSRFRKWAVPEELSSASARTEGANTASPASLQWPVRPSASSERSALFLNPSKAAPIPALIAEDVALTTPLELPTGPRSNEIGSVIHAALAWGLNTTCEVEIAHLRELVNRMEVSDQISAEALLRLITELKAGLQRSWPDATWVTELPFSMAIPSGQIARGQIDLLLKTKGRYVLIDHKSGRMDVKPEEKWAACLGQLRAYAELLPDTNAETWVFSVRTGRMVRLDARR